MLDIALEIIRTKKQRDYKRGIVAFFYPINHEWGIKFFLRPLKRDHTYDLQQHAANHMLAPKIGDKFEATAPNGNQLYGYFTEVLPITYIDDLLMRTEYSSEEELFKQHSYHFQYFKNVVAKKLLDDLAKIGICSTDLHWGNVGFLRGRLVCIDFSQDYWISVPKTADAPIDFQSEAFIIGM